MHGRQGVLRETQRVGRWANATVEAAGWRGALARIADRAVGLRRTLGAAALLGAAVVLSGCASTVTTEVTAFRDSAWRNEGPRTFAFESVPKNGAAATGTPAPVSPPAPVREPGLERATYEQWLAEALSGVGFEQVPRAQARYLVSMHAESDPRIVRVQETYYPDPWFPGPYWGPGYYRPWGPWGGGPWGPWGPGYWPPQTVVRDVPATLSTLRVYIREAQTNRRVYQVTAQNVAEGETLATAMPFLIRSAFAEFPMDSGRPRRITLEVDKSGGGPAR